METDAATVQKRTVPYEAFSLRSDETVTVLTERPSDTDARWFAVILRPIEMPPGPRVDVRQSDGTPIEQIAVLSCEMTKENQAWQWMQLSPHTKELIGDLMLDGGAEVDVWHYAVVTPSGHPT